MPKYDHVDIIKQTENRIDWLREQLIASQQHSCFDVTESIKNRLKIEEKELEELYSMR